jgi:hypothetical protein
LAVRTVIERTTAFVAAPLAIAIVVAVVSLGADRRLATAARAGLAAAAVITLLNALTTPAPNPLPLEDWKSAANYVANTLPPNMAIYAPIKTDELAAYLDHRRPVAKRLDRAALDRGRLAVLLFDPTKRAPNVDRLFPKSQTRYARAGFLQQRASAWDHYLPIYFAPPKESHLRSATVDGRRVPALIDRSLRTAVRAPQHGRSAVVDVALITDPNVAARSLLVATRNAKNPQRVTAVVTTTDGRREQLAPSAVRITPDLVSIDLGGRHVRSIDLEMRPRARVGSIVMTSAWIYPS